MPAVAAPQYTDPQLLDILSTALRAGFASSHAYDDYARANGAPSHATMAKRFGGWNNAKLHAGATEVNVPRGMAGPGSRSCAPSKPCTAHFWTVEVDGVIVYKDFRYPELYVLRKLGFPHNEGLDIVRVDYVAAA